jgi:hypothetical protein
VTPPQPSAEFELLDFNFDESNETFIADIEAEATEEVA